MKIEFNKWYYWWHDSNTIKRGQLDCIQDRGNSTTYLFSTRNYLGDCVVVQIEEQRLFTNINDLMKAKHD